MSQVDDASVLADLREAVLRAYDNLKPETDDDREVNAKTIGWLKEWFVTPERSLTSAAMYCVGRFVDAELDYQTAGNRGMGRMTELWPRFGGKHRSALGRCREALVAKLRNLFTRQVLCGYLFVEYLGECLSAQRLPRDATIADRERLFQQWIPMIYSPAGPPPLTKKCTGDSKSSTTT